MQLAANRLAIAISLSTLACTVAQRVGATHTDESALAPPRAAEPATDQRTLRLPLQHHDYTTVELPVHFAHAVALRFDNTPADNQTTNHGATLGRVLFYDTRLSRNGTISCGSCHVQKHAFDDPNRFSRGFAGALTDRHAMSLVNLRYHPTARFFWDERAGNLEDMVLLPIQNGIEMGQDLPALSAALSRDAHYPALFERAFGDPAITPQRIGRALAQFVRSMVSYRSRYDEGRAAAASGAVDFSNFTRQENQGKALFQRNCAACHLPLQEAHFATLSPTNTGLDEDPRTSDGGVGDITLNPRDMGHFKSPSLRNVEVTAPYMHDGRFQALEEVVDHYSAGGKSHPNKDVRIQPLNFTNADRAALIAFLKTLTDPAFLTDPKFSDPFELPSSQ